MSPDTVQNDGFAQMPLLHQPDAHCELIVQGLPAVGLGPSGLQTPPPLPFGTQDWPQQSESSAQEALSATHCVLEHDPDTHEPVQHWLPVTHVAPGNAQSVLGLPHLPLVASQFAEQQSVLLVHVSATGLHVPVSLRPPSMIASRNASPIAPVSPGSIIDPSALPPSLSPPSVVSPGTTESLPQATTMTLVIAAAAIKPKAVQGSLCMKAILLVHATAQRYGRRSLGGSRSRESDSDPFESGTDY